MAFPRVLTLWFLFMLLFCDSAAAQKFGDAYFTRLPQDYQLYPRNDKNEAAVPIAGYFDTAGYNYVSVWMEREGTRTKYLRAQVQYNGQKGTFATEATVKAELANYNFKVYAKKGNDSTLLVTRQKIVSGDALVIMGQSNSTGFFTDTETSEFCRTFGVITGTLNTEHYDAADTLWSLSNVSYKTNVGTMGLEIQKQLSEKNGIPNVLINGGIHWSSAYTHALRNADNPTDLGTAYGRMLYRLRKSGTAGVCKAFIYRQGETEAYHEGGDWAESFDRFYHNLQTDIPAILKTYVFQIDIIYYPSPTGAILRDYQRRLPDIYPDIRTLATVGTKEFDGLHYGRNGNIQSGFEVSRLISRDLYNSADTLNIDSPNLRKVISRGAEKNELVLVFDKNQDLVYPDPYRPNGNVTLEMKNFFYLDGWQGVVTEGRAEGNRVVLKLIGPLKAKQLYYLPPYLEEGGSYYPFTGPYLTNKKGMRAFSFYQVPIYDALGTPQLTVATEGSEVTLNWSAVPGAASYLLERKGELEERWAALTAAKAPTTSFRDKPMLAGTRKVAYRVKAVSENSESADYGTAEANVDIIAGVEDEKNKAVEIYPNPSGGDQALTVKARFSGPGSISFTDLNGRRIHEIPVAPQQDVFTVKPGTFAPGVYLLKTENGTDRSVKKVVILP